MGHSQDRHQLDLILARCGPIPQACLWHATHVAQVESERLDGRAGQGQHCLFLFVRSFLRSSSCT